jgi:hypothetical protein
VLRLGRRQRRVWHEPLQARSSPAFTLRGREGQGHMRLGTFVPVWQRQEQYRSNPFPDTDFLKLSITSDQLSSTPPLPQSAVGHSSGHEAPSAQRIPTSRGPCLPGRVWPRDGTISFKPYRIRTRSHSPSIADATHLSPLLCLRLHNELSIAVYAGPPFTRDSPIQNQSQSCLSNRSEQARPYSCFWYFAHYSDGILAKGQNQI